jgi:hypothetical protein
MRRLSLVLLFIFCCSSVTVAVSKSATKSWGTEEHVVPAAPVASVSSRHHHSAKPNVVNHQDPVKPPKIKKSHRVVERKKMALLPFSDSFSYNDFESQYSDVSRNERSIFEHIRKLNPSVSLEDAHVMASTLAIQGDEQGVDPKFVAAVMSVESRFN